jgi:hypothetical protein
MRRSRRVDRTFRSIIRAPNATRDSRPQKVTPLGERLNHYANQTCLDFRYEKKLKAIGLIRRLIISQRTEARRANKSNLEPLRDKHAT